MKEFVKYEIFKGKKYNVFKLFKVLYLNLNLRFVYYLRLSQWLRGKKIPYIHIYFNHKLITKYGCYIGSKAKIGIGVKFPHPNGIVIGETTTIGQNCTIYQQVTFGGKNIGDAQNNNYPTIGNNVIIFAGAKLIGNIIIGDNVIIGANSVVNKSFPSNSVIVGVPAKLLKELK
ncbi:MAG: serine O-acetyltransferase [Bacteroidales bacterium]|nr:serine O-acetyltransferase [Bacteroidales bacterium]